MRLHLLTMSAFGPFAGVERVDFDRLAADGLFLLCGPTGAGKTSILDAVAFALYGRLPGARAASRSRIRSDHADPATATFVELECTLAGSTVRIRRTPEHERPKRHGDGTTRQRHHVTLERRERDGSWSGVSSRADEVGDVVLERLGLDADQFFQVVLLPQGEFARFLRAEDDEREAVLTSLFSSQRFTAVEDWLAQLRTRARGDVEVYRARCRELAGLSAEHCGLPPGDVPAVPEPAWFGRLAADAQTVARRSADAAAAADLASVEVDTALGAARDLAGRVSRRDALERDRRRLDAERSSIVEDREVAERAVRVRGLALLVAAVHRVREAHATATAALAERRDRMTAVRPELAATGSTDLGRWVADRRADAGVLAEVLVEERQLVELTAALTERTAAATDAERILEQLVAERAPLPDELIRRTAALAEQRALSAGHPQRRERLRAARSALAGAEEAAKLVARRPLVLDELRSCVDAAQIARSGWLDLRQRRLDGMAAELAGGLSRGEPCPVCGAADHPSPARSAADAPSADEERAAQLDSERAEHHRAAVVVRLAKHDSRAAVALERSGGLPASELRAEVATAAAAERTAASASQRLRPDEAELLRLSERLNELQGMAAAAERAVTTARRAADRLGDEVTRLRRRLARHAGGFDSVAERAARLGAETDLVEQVLLAVATEQGTARTLRAAERDAEVEAVRCGASDVATATAYLRTDAEVARLHARIAHFDARWAATTAGLAVPDLVELPQRPPPLDPLVEAAARARDHARRTASSADADERRATRLAQIALRAADVLQEAGPAFDRLEEIEQLTALVRGEAGNRHRMRLTSYVLAARLEQVAAAASQRLEVMSRGRFRLEHTDERTNRRRTGGLGLVVRDAYTGRSRPTSTLSGGEAFLASLSLALGLAEVVTAEAGATTLDSLFVDEGFGSLDADTLDVVMDTLDELRAGGRAIGLISHVEEMRARIPTQLHLDRDSSGSRVRALADDDRAADPAVAG